MARMSLPKKPKKSKAKKGLFESDSDDSNCSFKKGEGIKPGVPVSVRKNICYDSSDSNIGPSDSDSDSSDSCDAYPKGRKGRPKNGKW